LVRTVGSLDLAIELRRSRFNVHMSNTLVFDVPVEQCLELMTSIGSNRVDAERELLYHVIDKINSVFLCMLPVDLESPDASGIVDCRVLKTTDLFPCGRFKREELHVHLDLMPGDSFRVPTCVNRPAPHVPRQATQTISDQRTINT
jgi:hypothetical protein